MKTRLLMFTFACVFCSCVSFSNRKNNESEINALKKEIVGCWTDKSGEFSYDFCSDGTWRSTRIDGNEKFYMKGKYVVGDDADVFLRCFGSRHWRISSDTIEDKKTSLGARVLFLQDGKLVNNQEDYENVYYKFH